MTEKPAAPLIEADLQNPVSTTTLDVPASAAPKGARLPVDGNVSNAEFALAINSLRDTIEDISDALDRMKAPSTYIGGAVSELDARLKNVSEAIDKLETHETVARAASFGSLAAAVRHLYVELGVRIPHA